jgi:L-cysteine desulfidase
MLHGGTPAQAERAAITLVGTLLGMICDGAKASCGLKVSSAAGEAWMAAMLALDDKGIQTTQGLISTNIRELGAPVRDFNDKALSAADAVMVALMVGLDNKKGCRACM